MVYAEELSARGILDGVRRGRTVVKLQGPSDPMIELAIEGTSLEARITGAEGGSLRWLKNGRELQMQPILEDPALLAVSAAPPASGEDRWRAEVSLDGSLRTMTSNVFVRAPESGCGCSTAGDRNDAARSALLLLALGLVVDRLRRTGI